MEIKRIFIIKKKIINIRLCFGQRHIISMYVQRPDTDEYNGENWEESVNICEIN